MQTTTVALAFQRATKNNVLYAVSGGFNKWYVPKAWYESHGQPATITLTFTPTKKATGDVVIWERDTANYGVYAQAGGFNHWYDPQKSGQDRAAFTVTAGGTLKHTPRSLRSA